MEIYLSSSCISANDALNMSPVRKFLLFKISKLKGWRELVLTAVRDIVELF